MNDAFKNVTVNSRGALIDRNIQFDHFLNKIVLVFYKN
jgi:hypothetical protein